MSRKNKLDREMLELILKLYSEVRFPIFLPEIPYEWFEEVMKNEARRNRNSENVD